MEYPLFSNEYVQFATALLMAIFQGVISLSLFLGQIVSAPLLAATNYSLVYTVGGVCQILGLLFTIFFLPESVDRTEQPERYTSVFKFELVFDMFRTCFRKRENGARAILWCCVCILGTVIFVMNGNFQLEYLFVREEFHWPLNKYTLFGGVRTITTMCGTMGGVYILSRVFKIREAILGIIAILSLIAVSTIKAFATKDWHMYATVPILLFSGMITPITRSIFSKTVPSQELGKVFSLASSVEAITPLAAAPLYTLVYNATLSYFTGAFQLISSGLYSISLIALIMIYLLQNKYRQAGFEPLLNEIES